MAVLVFLLAVFLLSLPFWFLGEVEVFSEIQIQLALLGLVLIVPGMALGAILGARTYRVENRRGMRAGAGIGATAGLTGYMLLFAVFQGLPLLLAPLILASALLLYALFATGQGLERRRWVFLLAAAISVLSGAVALTLNFDLLGLLGVLFCAAAAAVGGLVGGVGYARAGGDEMMPKRSGVGSGE